MNFRSWTASLVDWVSADLKLVGIAPQNTTNCSLTSIFQCISMFKNDSYSILAYPAYIMAEMLAGQPIQDFFDDA